MLLCEDHTWEASRTIVESPSSPNSGQRYAFKFLTVDEALLTSGVASVLRLLRVEAGSAIVILSMSMSNVEGSPAGTYLDAAVLRFPAAELAFLASSSAIFFISRFLSASHFALEAAIWNGD